jgi:chorismate mutase
MTKLNLEQIREKLASLEDSIIIGLFERARFMINIRMYVPGGVVVPDRFYFPNGNGIRFEGSFFDFMLLGTEALHAAAGRYEHPEEFSFSERLPKPQVRREKVESPVNKTEINKNKKIRAAYSAKLLKICREGDDKEYGSAALCDIRCLQDISKRVHLGMQVAEAKFQEDTEGYNILVKAGYFEGLKEKLRNPEVEKAVLERVRQKGERYGMNPEFVARFFEEDIMPLTIDVEVEYLKARAGK